MNTQHYSYFHVLLILIKYAILKRFEIIFSMAIIHLQSDDINLSYYC